MNPNIDDMIAPIGGASKTISDPETKEVVADAARGGVWVNWNPGQGNRTVRDGRTPCDTGLTVRSKPAPSTVLIGTTTIYPDCSISGSVQVGKKRQSTPQNKVGNTQKLDTVFDRNFPDDRYPASVFGKVIGRELSHGFSNNLYSRCSMPSMHQISSVSKVLLLPGFKGQRMGTIGRRWIMFL